MEHEDKNEHIHRLTELENHLGKMLSDNLKIPVYTIDSKAIDDLYSLVIKRNKRIDNRLYLQHAPT